MTAFFEAENGSRSSSVTLVSDAAASGGSAIQYGTGVTPPASSVFSASFETASDYYDRFDWGVHHRNDTGNNHGATWTGTHNMACDPPPTTRTVVAVDVG